MKISHLFIAALIAFLGFSASAEAASYGYTFSPVAVTKATYSPKQVRSSLTGVSGANDYTFTEAGTLAKNTKVTYTFTATNVLADSFYFESNLGTVGGTTKTLLFSSGGSSTLTVGGLPVLLTAAFTSTSSTLGTLVGTIVLTNMTTSIKNFAANFVAYLTQVSGTITVTAFTSPVPLPPAAWLFISGLVVLAGFATYKRVRGQI
jgi:hypothetical protein